jgi:hypothetical protein
VRKDVLNPTPSRIEPAEEAPERLRGTLMALNDAGYGFLFTGKGKPQVFIMRSQLPDPAWVKGTVIEFAMLPPKKGTKCPRAGDPTVVSQLIGQKSED